MRVVHVICTANFAGVESHVASLAHQQVVDGDEVTVIGGDFSRMSVAGSYAWLPGDSAREAARSLKRVANDITHAHMTRAEFAATVLTRQRPVVATRHFARRRAASTHRVIAPLIASQISAQIAVSQYVADAIETPAVIIPGGVSVREAASAKSRTKTVLVLQRLEEEKRPLDAVEAFHLSGLWRESWRLVFVGSGSLEGVVRQRVSELSLGEHVDLKGHQPDPGQFLSSAGVLLAPCPVEAQGLAVLEAMACALPVVATAAGGHLESVGAVVDPALFAPSDVVDAAAWLRRIAEDQDAADAYGARLRRVQRQRFTLQAQARDVRTVYEGVL